MTAAAVVDHEVIERHRRIWAVRPELRAVYHEWFARLLALTTGLAPVVEIGGGPGFLKEYAPRVIATDILPVAGIDVACDAGALPLRGGEIGALVMVDTLHHLPRPLQFLDEAARVLRPGGRLVLLEPWITPASYLLYRYVHHEDCRLGVDPAAPFSVSGKRAFDGNAAIPFTVLRRLRARPAPLRLVHAETFVGLPYLATLGFMRARPVPAVSVRVARALERLTRPLRPLASSRIFAVLEKPA